MTVFCHSLLRISTPYPPPGACVPSSSPRITHRAPFYDCDNVRTAIANCPNPKTTAHLHDAAEHGQRQSPQPTARHVRTRRTTDDWPSRSTWLTATDGRTLARSRAAWRLSCRQAYGPAAGIVWLLLALNSQPRFSLGPLRCLASFVGPLDNREVAYCGSAPALLGY